jgi:hypothetical protein
MAWITAARSLDCCLIQHPTGSELGMRIDEHDITDSTAPRERRSIMSLTEITVQGTLNPDGSLELDQKPNLSPGRVTVVLRQQVAQGVECAFTLAFVRNRVAGTLQDALTGSGILDHGQRVQVVTRGLA